MSAQVRCLLWMALIVLAAGLLLPAGVFAHHGWAWATEDEFEITGRISAVKLGNPHGQVSIMVGDETWVVEVGQPWRNEGAGLSDELLRVGRVMTVYGHRSAQVDERLVKAERVVIDGKSYNLYPDRKS